MKIRRAAAAALAITTITALGGPALAEPEGGTQPLHPKPIAAKALAEAPDIDVAEVQKHLSALETIATENDGNRSTGSSGYRASVGYVTSQLEGAGYTVNEQPFETSYGESYNLTADLPGTDPNRVLMLGGHLDSVDEGPGINDNGTGSAAEIATALAFAQANPDPSITIRFAWWGAEEQGLLGSSHYVENLDQAELDKIDAYLNFDMIGSPNGGYFVYDGQAEMEGQFDEFLAGRGFTTEKTSAGGRSDHAAFEDAGIPIGGLFTGAEEIKSAAQAEAWGGTANEPFDGCYHASCDTTENVDATILDNMTDAMSFVLWSQTAPAAASLKPAA